MSVDRTTELIQKIVDDALNPLGGLDVNIQDQTTPAVEHFLYQELNAVVITGTPQRGDNVLNLEAGHNFVNPVSPNADYLNIHYVDTDLPGFLGSRFNQFVVTSVNVNEISINPPLPYNLDVLKVERSQRVNVNMGVDGGSRLTPVKFQTTPPNGQDWDLTRFIGDMILTSGGDDGKFGNLTALTNGMYFGFENSIFAEYQLTAFDNGSFRASSYDLVYPSRSGGGGDFGMSFRKTVAKSGVVIRLEGLTDDLFVAYIQDPLGALPRFRIKVGGHVVD